MKTLGTHTGKLFGTDIPKSGTPVFKENDQGFGVHMSIKPLTKKHEEGSVPTKAAHKIYDKLDLRRMSGGASYYMRGHLLNHNLGGPGSWNNLTPLSREGNHQHESQVESVVKAAVNSGAIVEYIVNAPTAQEEIYQPLHKN